MSRLNILKALERLELSSQFHANAYRFIFTLETPSSRFYNPHAAGIIRRILKDISSNKSAKDKQLRHLVTLFVGQIESLLISTSNNFDSQSLSNILSSALNGRITPFKPISKVIFQEKITGLLYAKEVREIYAIENYYPTVSFSDSSTSIMVHASIMRYLRDTPEMVYRQKKLSYLNKRASDPSVSNEDRLIAEILAKYLSVHISDTITEGGESFDQLFRKIAESKGLKDDSVIKKCIQIRNKAVHEGKCYWNFYDLGIYFRLLLSSPMAISSSQEFDNESRLIEHAVKAEMEKDIRRNRIKKIIMTSIWILFIAIVAYIGIMFIVGSYIGESDAERLRWDSNNSQFNARMNEIIATKDTTQLLEVQKDLKWINDNFYQPEN